MFTLSDITICYNDKNGLKATLDSFLNQDVLVDRDCSWLEIIVVDGGSTDGSVELIKEYQDKFETKGIEYRYVSESDSGRYQAMNKGIKLAKNDYLIFMNSGDCLVEKNTLGELENKIEEWMNFKPAGIVDIFYGDCLRQYESESIVQRAFPIDSIKKGLPFSHQSAITRAELMKKRLYVERLNISADYEWFLWAYTEGKIFQYIPMVISSFDKEGISSTALYKTYLEAIKIREKYGIADPYIISKLKQICWFFLDKINPDGKRLEQFTEKLARNRGNRC